MSPELVGFLSLFFLILAFSSSIATYVIACVHCQYPKTDNPFKWKVKALSLASAILSTLALGFTIYGEILAKAVEV